MQSNILSFKKRREHLIKKIGPSGIAVLFAPKKPWGNKKISWPYRQDSDFYYLTGFKEPEAIAVIAPNYPGGDFILFNRVRDPLQEFWYGKREGQESACKNYGANQAFPITMADEMLPQMLLGREKIYFNINQESIAKITSWFEQLIAKGTGIDESTQLISIGAITHEMRVYKDAEEISIMKKSAAIIVQAQLQAMRTCRPNIKEYELEAEILRECVRNGARFQAFEPIVASGANTCILHYISNDEILENGSLVLLDTGAEYEFYASDITRTYPVNGQFNKEQRAVYQAVLDTQLTLLEHAQPGVKWIELQELSERIITEKLLELGLLNGNLEKLIIDKACKTFYMHKFGHWIGLDVHDVGWHKDAKGWRVLEPNMLMTVEPGIYISKNITGLDSKWYNIGVRIEDTILITENGCEILTKGVPKTIDEIEMFMAHKW